MEDITVEELKSRLESGEKITLIDVREIYEHEEYHIGGRLIPLGDLINEAPGLDYNQEEEIIVYCRSGNRSDMGKHVLLMNGFKNARNLLGGILAWRANEQESD